jgi:hypothetical protein
MFSFLKMTFGKVIQMSYCKLQNKRISINASHCFCEAGNSLFSSCLSQTIKYSTASTIYALSSGIILNNA